MVIIILCFSQDLIGYSDSWEFFFEKNFSSQIPFLILYLLCQFLDLCFWQRVPILHRESCMVECEVGSVTDSAAHNSK